MNLNFLQDKTSFEGSNNVPNSLFAKNRFSWTVKIMDLLRRIATDTNTC